MQCGASRSKRPRRHQRELFLPECTAVRSDPFGHDDVHTRIAQRIRPPGGILVEEGLQRASDQVGPRHSARKIFSWSVASARRGAEDRTVDLRMSEPEGER